MSGSLTRGLSPAVRTRVYVRTGICQGQFLRRRRQPPGRRERVKMEVLKFEHEDGRVRGSVRHYSARRPCCQVSPRRSRLLTTLEPCFVHASVRGGFPVHAHVKAASMPVSTVMGLGSDSSRGPTGVGGERRGTQEVKTYSSGLIFTHTFTFVHDLVRNSLLSKKRN